MNYKIGNYYRIVFKQSPGTFWIAKLIDIRGDSLITNIYISNLDIYPSTREQYEFAEHYYDWYDMSYEELIAFKLEN